MFSNTFAGITPASVPGYIVAQLIGGLAAMMVIMTLYPHVTPEQAAEVVLPHGNDHAGNAAGNLSAPGKPSM